jgi:peroxiredoxin
MVLEVKRSAPDFSLLSQEGKPLTLGEFRGSNVMLAFYPADWTPVCTHELALFQETLDDIRDHHCQVLGISVDSHHTHRAWAKTQHLTFPLLADFWPHGGVARQYGVFREQDGVSERALFFVDPGGLVFDTWVSEDPNIAPGLDIVFGTLERMQGQRGARPPAEEAHHA